MRIMMLQLSGFSYNVPKTVGLIIWPLLTSSTNPSGPIHPALKQRTLGQGAHEPHNGLGSDKGNSSKVHLTGLWSTIL